MNNWKKLVDSEIIGVKYNRLLLLETFIKNWVRYGKFLCDCGNITTKNFNHVKRGLTTSCGCHHKQEMSKRNTTHGKTNTLEFSTWQRMINRCYNNNDRAYRNYGARGIKVCERWLNSFQNFLEDMGIRSTNEHSLDRFPNNDGGYEKENCRWATLKEQASNKRTNRWIEYDGRRMILTEWANELGRKQSEISAMMKRKPFSEVYNYYKNKYH